MVNRDFYVYFFFVCIGFLIITINLFFCDSLTIVNHYCLRIAKEVYFTVPFYFFPFYFMEPSMRESASALTGLEY